MTAMKPTKIEFKDAYHYCRKIKGFLRLAS